MICRNIITKSVSQNNSVLSLEKLDFHGYEKNINTSHLNLEKINFFGKYIREISALGDSAYEDDEAKILKVRARGHLGRNARLLWHAART